MEYRSNEIKAGCFVIISIFLLLAFLIIISGLDILKSTKTYLARFKYTSGIAVGSLVRFGGMEVGRVVGVKISEADNSLIEFELEVDEKAPVKEDSEVFITSIGIMGEYYIEISTGSPEGKSLPPGSLLNCIDVPPLMMLTQSFDKLTSQLEVTIKGINQMLGHDNQLQFNNILVNLNRLLEDNQKTVSSLVANMDAVLSDFHGMGSKMDTLLSQNQDGIARSVQHLEMTLAQTYEMIQQFQQTMTHINDVLVYQNNNYDEIMNNLNRTTKNLDDFSRTIKERPWSLIRKSEVRERQIK
ncbi:MAG TPA: MCE family protein [bacterium]|nr:MCE family protein [bacterium]